MKNYIASAGVYLATARETFGIGTLEAMACGVPVAGWDWGGQSEIIVDGVNGYLAPPGDFDALADCVRRCIAGRDTLGANAREDVGSRWGWETRVEQYADIYQKALDDWKTPGPKVSVVVTAYKLDKYLLDCLKSIKTQSMSDFECLVIDDASLDSTKEIVAGFMREDSRFKYIRPPENLGLSLARNFGFRKARGKYIRFVDGDDMLDEHALGLESDLLDNERGVHISYGHLKIINEDGSDFQYSGDRTRNDFPPDSFSWRAQMAHLNAIPSSCMVRRQSFERSGGYRKRHWRAEDAAYYCRVTSLGQRAKKATKRETIIYRQRADSKSIVERNTVGGDGDWTAWYPWRICGSPREAKHLWPKIVSRQLPATELVPYGAAGRPPKERKSWFVHDYAYPNVSVIVTCGPGHEALVIDAVESVLAQSYPDWELIVVNDTGKAWPDDLRSPVAGAPYVTVVDTKGGNRGAAHARNYGATFTSAPLLAWLDADDYWLPDFLKETVAMYEANSGIIATGWLKNDGDGSNMHYEQPKMVECGQVLKKMNHAGTSILVPRWAHEKIVEAQGGWDEKIIGMEDWDYQIAAQIYAKACSFIVDKPLFVYRFSTSTKRERDYEKIEDITKYVYNKYHPYYSGEKDVACGCKGRKKPVKTPSSMLTSSGKFTSSSPAMSPASGEASGAMITLEYVGPREEPFTIRGKATRRRYKFGGPHNKQKLVYVEDAEYLLGVRLADNRPEYIQIDRPEGVAPVGIGAEDFVGTRLTPGVTEPVMPKAVGTD